ncbi:MAG: hypothetical protein HXY23_14255 [Parvularculaceae bacterium]|nr:hypothetical protein [Parvularculaceae bacterium]
MTKQQKRRWDEDGRNLFEFMGLPWPYRRPKQAWKRAEDGKILTLADPHEPCANEVVMLHAWKYHRDARTVIVTGDLGDYYSRSRFRKRKHVAFRDELVAVFNRLEWLATNWLDVRVMIGNHDDRPEKYMTDNVPDAESLIMTERNMLDRLAGFFDNVQIVGHQVPGTAVNITHIYQHGDILFTHGEVSLKQDSGILTRIDDYAKAWNSHLDLKPWRVLAQSHNHRESSKASSRGKKWMLLPTCSDPYGTSFDYIYTPRMMGTPPDVGFSIFWQFGGVTDINESRSFVFPVVGGRTMPI